MILFCFLFYFLLSLAKGRLGKVSVWDMEARMEGVLVECSRWINGKEVYKKAEKWYKVGFMGN